MADTTYDYLLTSNKASTPFQPSNKMLALSEGLCSPQSTGSYLSSTSTTHSSSLSPCLEKQQDGKGSWSPFSQEDMDYKQQMSRSSEDLQSVMDAEEELQAIWGTKSKKLNVRTVTSAAHPINKFRSRWSDVQSENSYSHSEPLHSQAFERKNSFNLVPSRPSNPQGRDSFFQD